MPPNDQDPGTKITREPLSWLFVAFFTDGSVIRQTPEDKCTSRADGTGSAFTDVLGYNDQISKLVQFELHHTDGVQKLSVDLISGAFIANGIVMHLHNQNFEPTKYELELIYFRETRVERVVDATIQDDMSIKEVPDTLRHYVSRYFIGWQCLVNGKNKQVTLAVG